jgi:hypothetical protein
MKTRNYYPKQVMRRLAGRSVDTLDAGEVAALVFFMRKGRKYNMAVGTIGDAKVADLLNAQNKNAADAILSNATSRVFLKVS